MSILVQLVDVRSRCAAAFRLHDSLHTLPDHLKPHRMIHVVINPKSRRYVMTELRQKMIRALDLKNLSNHTKRSYLAAVTGLAKHYQQSPEKITKR